MQKIKEPVFNQLERNAALTPNTAEMRSAVKSSESTVLHDWLKRRLTRASQFNMRKVLKKTVPTQ